MFDNFGKSLMWVFLHIQTYFIGNYIDNDGGNNDDDPGLSSQFWVSILSDSLLIVLIQIYIFKQCIYCQMVVNCYKEAPDSKTNVYTIAPV